jgi:hypothetical protein
MIFRQSSRFLESVERVTKGAEAMVGAQDYVGFEAGVRSLESVLLTQGKPYILQERYLTEHITVLVVAGERALKANLIDIKVKDASGKVVAKPEARESAMSVSYTLGAPQEYTIEISLRKGAPAKAIISLLFFTVGEGITMPFSAFRAAATNLAKAVRTLTPQPGFFVQLGIANPGLSAYFEVNNVAKNDQLMTCTNASSQSLGVEIMDSDKAERGSLLVSKPGRPVVFPRAVKQVMASTAKNTTKKPVVVAAALLLVPVALVAAGQGKPGASEAKPPELTFAAGKKEVTVKGQLTKKSPTASYLLKAEKGQKLELKVDKSDFSPVVMIDFPDKSSDGGPVGVETEVPKSGVCTITVRLKGGDTGGKSSDYSLEKGKFTLIVKKL